MSERSDMPPRLSSESIGNLVAPLAEKLDQTVGWDRLPPNLGMLVLLGLRQRLRQRNLYDAESPPRQANSATAAPPAQLPDARTVDGSRTDPDDPRMGSAGMGFARNVPPVFEDAKKIKSPCPWVISERLLARNGTFYAAESLNLLAAAWLQFEVHDWFVHQTDRQNPAYLERTHDLPDDQRREPAPLARGPAADGRYAPFISDQTHWWDASQLYGATGDFTRAIRDGDGRVKVDFELLEAMERFMERSPEGVAPAVPNLWIGTALLHILFAREHNAICDRLQHEDPSLKDDRLYDKARLVNAAIMAKIHTVEWTPAVIAHPATARAIHATWSGFLSADHRRQTGRGVPDEILHGVPGSQLSHDGAPYALTEEFVAVYRMHQLLPDEVKFHSVADGGDLEKMPFADLAVGRDALERPRERLQTIGPGNAYYSLGIAHPGQITLHNYPDFLREFTSVDGDKLDVGAIDIFRTREAGVPRYNNFRRLFRLRPASSFQDIANGNPAWAHEIEDVYEGKLEDVDLLVGMFAERKPAGFAFSDTAFRVFLLMATRRLRSDRFFTRDYTPEVYTRTGLEWIEGATLAGMLRYHYPELREVLLTVR
ncbi:MAG TPA: peroxidase family protein, partial [Solirubrobacteraceae bacterium]